MSRWPLVALGEVLTFARDPNEVDPETIYPNVGIYSFARGVFEKPPIKGNATSAITLYRIRAGQFIYSRLFAFEGAYGVVPERLDGYFVSNEFPTFDCDGRKLLPGYMKWLFSQLVVWRELAAVSTGLGNRRQRVHPDRLLEHRIPLPPLHEQQRIVAQLDEVARRIEERGRAAETVEVELVASLRAAFRRIATDAPRVRIGDVAPLVRRPIEIDPEAKYPELGVRSFGKGTFHKSSLSGFEVGTKRLFRIEQGDLLFNIVFAWEGAVAVATARDHGRLGSHRFLTCVPNPGRVTSTFLRYFFLTEEGLQRLGEASPGGAGRNRTLGLQALHAIEVPVPSLDAQRWFDMLQTKAAAVRSRHTDIAGDLKRLIPAMLDRVFNGVSP